ncbi:unnamed protein product [Protopolystoma xenopodis]|uniref:KY-like immunoglobulin-like domain-containing protein n=1 Tax=Protopolystoma xenopodis TaxID=117903 RepID=A0A3S5BLC2_9PLAT|nr:unnamed protein product [Protopolystoma xenopodis]
MPRFVGISCSLENCADNSVLRGLCLVEVLIRPIDMVRIQAAPSQPGRYYLNIYVSNDWRREDCRELACSFQILCSEHNYARLVVMGRLPEVGFLGRTPAAQRYGVVMLASSDTSPLSRSSLPGLGTANTDGVGGSSNSREAGGWESESAEFTAATAAARTSSRLLGTRNKRANVLPTPLFSTTSSGVASIRPYLLFSGSGGSRVAGGGKGGTREDASLRIPFAIAPGLKVHLLYKA